MCACCVHFSVASFLILGVIPQNDLVGSQGIGVTTGERVDLNQICKNMSSWLQSFGHAVVKSVVALMMSCSNLRFEPWGTAWDRIANFERRLCINKSLLDADFLQLLQHESWTISLLWRVWARLKNIQNLKMTIDDSTPLIDLDSEFEAPPWWWTPQHTYELHLHLQTCTCQACWLDHLDLLQWPQAHPMSSPAT